MLNSPVRRGVSKYAFAAGLVLGGIITGSGVLLVGSVLRWAAPAMVIAVASIVWLAVITARELNLLRFALPQNARLVPETVFRHGPVFGPLQFGLEMGTGMRTYLPSGLPYVALVLVAGFATPVTAVVTGAAFGLGRAAMTFGSLRYGGNGEWDSEWTRRQRWLRPTLVVTFVAAHAVLLLPLLSPLWS
jgi:sulfite exporter TauE/SafE